jgi:hypothetical protein
VVDIARLKPDVVVFDTLKMEGQSRFPSLRLSIDAMFL